MEKILTVSVAAYQVENYIEENLSSMISEYLVDKIEVFVVDDGGRDKTLEIAQKFKKKYPDCIHAVHKQNGGYGSVYNYVIEKASGKYFKLLDGDDWFNTKELESLVAKLEKCDADVIAMNYCKGPSKEELEPVIINENKDNYVVKLENFSSKLAIGMWALAYKTELLKKSGMKLPEHMLYTDQIYSSVPFATAKTICFFNDTVYCYRVGRDGQSVSRDSRIKHEEEMLSSTRFLIDFYEKQKKKGNPNCDYLANRISRYHVISLKTIMLSKITKENYRKLKSFDKTVAKKSKDIYNLSTDSGDSGKLISLLRKTNYNAYWLLKFIPGGLPNWE